MSVSVDQKAPKFTSLVDDGTSVSLSDFLGQPVVLYFYPRDDTPGCTTESCGFRDMMPHFSKLNCTVLGVSKDSVASHQKFKQKHGLNFPLISDAHGTLCEDFGVWVEKNMYGKKYMGIERSTFLIDGKGVVRGVWRKVKVPGHVDEVLAALKKL